MGDLPLGEELDWTPAGRPERVELEGRYVTVRPLDPDGDFPALFAESRDPALWAYMPYGPFESEEAFGRYLAWAASADDPFFFTLAAERPAGIASYLRIEPDHGVIEIGHIWFGASLARTRAATEGIYLLARHAFEDLGYRRFEWKCNALNAKSRRAAERFGFTFEGVFRQHMVIKGRNRDTAWFAITDGDWPGVRERFERWLDPANFGADGRQRTPLGG